MKLSKLTKAVFPLLLMGFAHNSHAIDTYNFTTKTLIIPQVMVGDITYNDVTLRMNDFEVLGIGSNPLTGILNDGVVLQFNSAVRQAGQLHITMTVTSKGKDRKMSPGYKKHRVTDNKGAIYDLNAVATPRSNETSSSYIGHTFDADTPVTVIYTYDKFDPQASIISLLDMHIDSRNFKLRDIPVTEFDFTK